ncbi:hypothetical protein HAX54_008248, partial [Datura stramonium]|nr:hypothetical protein [Datura stramonium]
QHEAPTPPPNQPRETTTTLAQGQAQRDSYNGTLPGTTRTFPMRDNHGDATLCCRNG